MQADKEVKVSHATACSNVSLPSVDKASGSTLQSKYYLIYNFLSVFSLGKVFPCSPAGIWEQRVLAPLCHGPVGMSWSPLCIVLCGEGRVAHCPVLAVGRHHPLAEALLGAIGTVHGRSGPRFPDRV